MNIYGLVMAGVLTYMAYMEKMPPLSSSLFHLLLGFLVILTFVGFFLTSRWVYAFESHREKVNILAKMLWAESKVNSALDPTMNIPPTDVMPESIKGKKIPKRVREFSNGIFRTRYWFPLFYFIVLLGFAIFFSIARFPGPSIGIAITAWVVACLLGVRWYFSLKGIKDKISS
jgi:multisubunit Na+/H+ antiporter MnhB subunit